MPPTSFADGEMRGRSNDDVVSVLSWRGRDPLAWLLSPTPLDEFFDRVWEKEALLLKRNQPDYYTELLTFDDVNAFMSRNDIRYPYLRLVKEGRELPLVDYADDFVYGSNIFPGLLDNDKVFAHYSEGATLSFQIFQKCMEELSAFCNSLESRLRFQTQVNIFVTPPHSKGFTAHYDDHSFFIMQISGSKHWKLYDNPVELPLPEFRVKTGTPDLGSPRDVTLNAGDVLYLPRGFYHEAHTSDATSVHITLGIFPHTWIKVFERLLDRLKQDVEFRRAPTDYMRAGSPEGLQEQFDALLGKIAGTQVSSLLEELFEEAASKQIVDGKNRLRDLARIRELNPDTILRRRSVVFRITADERGLRLNFYDKTINFPKAAGEVLEFILASERFSVADLPGPLDEASRMSVVRKLMKEGLLTFDLAD